MLKLVNLAGGLALLLLGRKLVWIRRHSHVLLEKE